MDQLYVKLLIRHNMHTVYGIVMKTPTVIYKAYAYPIIWTCQTVWGRIQGSIFCILSLGSYALGEKSRNRRAKYFYYWTSAFFMVAHWAKVYWNLSAPLEQV